MTMTGAAGAVADQNAWIWIFLHSALSEMNLINRSEYASGLTVEISAFVCDGRIVDQITRGADSANPHRDKAHDTQAAVGSVHSPHA